MPKPNITGSILDADTPAHGVKLARRNTFTEAAGRGICDALERDSPTNYDIRYSVHNRLREWARDEQSTLGIQDVNLIRTLTECADMGMTTVYERGREDVLLLALPASVAFHDDPGRAFEIGMDLAGLIDADFYTRMSTGCLVTLPPEAPSV